MGHPGAGLQRGAFRLDRVPRRPADHARPLHPPRLHPDVHQHAGGHPGGEAEEGFRARRLRRAGRAALRAQLSLALLLGPRLGQPRSPARQVAAQEVRGRAGAQGPGVIALAAAVVAAAGFRYDVTASEGARELAIEARIPAFPDRDGELSVDGGAEPFVRDVVMVTADGAAPIERRGDSWYARGCAARGCRIRYRFALREAAVARDDDDLAALYGETVESPPGAWLLRPMRMPEGAPAELIVSVPEGLRFVAGLPQGSLLASRLGELPYAAFGKFRVERLQIEGGSPTVAIARASRRQTEEELLEWIRSSAALISRYFGRFPVDGALLLVLPASGHQIHGRCRGTGGASILFFL